ncbi:MAG: 1-acyl-sn-glycerol-3-phosphate acyltransferase [Alphaproteobacteria bacterium]|nr:1-acyl-sn-glycerol-3-phosphate acyltransferase [Alphaproteobacteria bacterium]
MFIRSFIFNAIFYGWTLLCCILFLPVLILPRFFILKTTKIWIYGVVWICENILGLHIKVVGQERWLISPAIFAVKHQSAWETLIFHYFLVDSSIVLKKELVWIPFFGWYIKKLQMVPLSRSKNKGMQDLKNLLRAAEEAIRKGRPIVIFPEGTRSIPGQKTTYHSGIASIYLHLKIPVIPIAHNAGLFWPRRGFMKYPGCITLELLEPILPGLTRQEFMRVLENRIETKTNELMNQGI